MSVEEVLLVAGDGALHIEDEEGNRVHDQHRLVSTTTTEDGIAYDAEFYFDPDTSRLTLVRLSAQSGDTCDAVRTAHLARLGGGKEGKKNIGARGNPVQATINTLHWPDGANGAVIEFSDFSIPILDDRSCHVLYQQHDFVEN